MDKKRPNKSPGRRERPGHQAITVHLYASKPHNALILRYLNDQGMSLSDAVINTLHQTSRNHARRVANKRYGHSESEVTFLTDEELLGLMNNGVVNKVVAVKEIPKETPLVKPKSKPVKTELKEDKYEKTNTDDEPIDF